MLPALADLDPDAAQAATDHYDRCRCEEPAGEQGDSGRRLLIIEMDRNIGLALQVEVRGQVV